MAQNSIGYEGNVVIKDADRPKTITRAGNGMAILRLTLAETHSMKLGRAKKDPGMKKYVDDDRNLGKTDDDYINTTTSWHRITIIGDKAEEYAQNPEINHGALITVDNASYDEEAPWETKDGVLRAGRPETIGDTKGSITVKFPPREPAGALWDGVSDLPKAGGGGGGGQREYADDEGF